MTMQRTPLLLSRLMDRGARVAPNEQVVTKQPDGLHRQTLAQTRARAAQLAHALRADGVKLGERVASLLWNNHRHLEMYQAIPSMGCVLHTLNLRLALGELQYIINHAEDAVIVVDQSHLALLEQLAGKIPSVRRVIVASEPGAGAWKSALPGAVDYEDFIGRHAKEIEWPEFDENAGAALCYTSGTTGDPKGVLYTHRSTYLHTMAQCMTDSMGLSAQDCLLQIVPMFHAMGWGAPFSVLTLGAKTVMPHRFMDPKSLVELMSGEEVTISLGVPTIWQGVRAFLEQNPGADLGSLTRMTCGGSAPPISLIEWYAKKYGVEMIQGWGMTETNPLVTLSRRIAKRSQRKSLPEEQMSNQAKAGQVVPGIDLSIIDENGRHLPHDGKSIGEVIVRGPWIAAEYYKNPQPAKFHEGWLRTGDVAMIDPEEYLIITDRTKDLIKSGGEWISSVDLENHICALPGVAQAAVVGVPHPKWDERPVAIVVRAPGSTVTQQQVLAHCEGRFAKWQLPDEVLFRDAIPLTSTGKIDKKVIRAGLSAERYALPDQR
ncbi:MAG TPA: long-chain fatty acid--CoA ligase [Myxococcota bacterium]|nr:long-chain fatty acid--CoA ligase [Myxococcota bacterium]